MKVQLINHTNADPLELTTHAGKICYSSESPPRGQVMDVENQLWKTGHHSTPQHWSASFRVEGIAVADVDFGLHLPSPYYVTDQQSGRFCLGMYANPDFDAIMEYTRSLYPETPEVTLKQIRLYLIHQMEMYNDNLTKAEELARKMIPLERPFANEKFVDANAPKFAQEQMRMFIPLIFPTRLVFTVNLVTLAALYKAAWSPGMLQVTGLMVKALLEKFPELEFMFSRGLHTEWSPSFDWGSDRIRTEPGYMLERLDAYPNVAPPTRDDKHPLDLLRAMPRFMDIAASSMRETVSVSCAAYGQVQRSRTFRRSVPKFTGAIYMPPLLAKLDLEQSMLDSLTEWMKFEGKVHPMLLATLAPYGAMITFRHEMDLTAATHEGDQRTCWCAQEEFYHLNGGRRLAIQDRHPGHPLLDVLAPQCFGASMKCGQGKRYCGRDIKAQTLPNTNYFPRRVV